MTNTNEITLEKEENKMGVMPIPKLLITMSLPMMISMPVSYTHLTLPTNSRV